MSAATAWSGQPHKAYTYHRLPDGTWEQDEVLDGTPYGASNHFGLRDVAIGGDTVLIGDPYVFNQATGYTSGAVFIWEHDGTSWTGPEFLWGDSFGFQNFTGYSVDIDQLKREFSWVNWLTFEDWAKNQDWSPIK